LLEDIVEYLLDRPLSGVSFRTLAEGLGVSTYTLVYHFGSKAGMVHDIVETASERQRVVLSAVDEETGDIDVHLANIRSSWQAAIDPRATKLLRLELEAALYESHDPAATITREMYNEWIRVGMVSLLKMGVPRAAAEEQVRLIVDIFYGLQFDLIITGEVGRASAAFDLSLQAYEQRLRRLIAQSVSA